VEHAHKRDLAGQRHTDAPVLRNQSDDGIADQEGWYYVSATSNDWNASIAANPSGDAYATWNSMDSPPCFEPQIRFTSREGSDPLHVMNDQVVLAASGLATTRRLTRTNGGGITQLFRSIPRTIRGALQDAARGSSTSTHRGRRTRRRSIGARGSGASVSAKAVGPNAHGFFGADTRISAPRTHIAPGVTVGELAANAGARTESYRTVRKLGGASRRRSSSPRLPSQPSGRTARAGPTSGQLGPPRGPKSPSSGATMPAVRFRSCTRTDVGSADSSPRPARYAVLSGRPTAGCSRLRKRFVWGRRLR
jgi:hypothetical protein